MGEITERKGHAVPGVSSWGDKTQEENEGGCGELRLE